MPLVACHHKPRAPATLKAPAEQLVHGPKGTAPASVYARLQRQGQHDRLGDEIETFDVVDTQPRDCPSCVTAAQSTAPLAGRKPKAAGGA